MGIKFRKLIERQASRPSRTSAEEGYDVSSSFANQFLSTFFTCHSNERDDDKLQKNVLIVFLLQGVSGILD